MNKLITIKTFTYSSEVAVLQGLLESEGIQCFVKDELMAQVNPFYSNAIGGIKLQIQESDLEAALKILEEGGYLDEKVDQPSPLYVKLNKLLSRIFTKK